MFIVTTFIVVSLKSPPINMRVSKPNFCSPVKFLSNGTSERIDRLGGGRLV